MLDRTAELQLEPDPSPGALRTRKWRENKRNQKPSSRDEAVQNLTDENYGTRETADIVGTSRQTTPNTVQNLTDETPEASPETLPSVTERHTEPVTPCDVSPSGKETDFDWDKNANDIVQPQTDAVALYLNPKGFLVIRRAASWPSEEDDAIITIAPECQQAFVDRVCDLMGIPGFP
jgi:hypothetical protein